MTVEAFENFAVAPAIGEIENGGHEAVESLIEIHQPRFNERDAGCSSFKKD
jgi:hypothetical protein